MADTSSYSIEERLVASVWVYEREHTGQTMFQVMAAFREWVYERQHTGQTVSQVMAVFRERFNKAPPHRATLLDWEKRAFVLGSVKI
jgi:hypothetical protein